MAETKFTPGPWTTTKRIEASWAIFESGDYNIIPPIGHAGPVAIAGGEYNARLTAAAPDLYAALKAFVKQWNACGPNSDFGRHFKPVRDQALAAISKATLAQED